MPNEHLSFPPETNVRADEVEVRFTHENHQYNVRLDPGKVSAVVWDSQIAQWLGLPADGGQELLPPHGMQDFAGPGFDQGFEVKRIPGNLIHTGVQNQVFVNFPPPGQPDEDRWYRIPNVVIRQIVLRYKVIANPDEAYEVEFPVRTTVAGGNVSADWPAEAEQTHIDMLWWTARLCAKIRKEMKQNGREVGRHWKVRSDGKLAESNETPASQLRARIPQHRRIAIATSHSADCSYCYHFNNCEWGCTGNFA